MIIMKAKLGSHQKDKNYHQDSIKVVKGSTTKDIFR